MGFAYLIVGCFFLMNPNISIFDLLPDFIGYACMLKGLVKLSKLSADFEAAYRSFRTLFIIALLRILTIPLAGGDDQTWVLLMVFCFGLVEGYLSFRAFASFFEGFSYTAQRGESNAVFGRWSETRLLTLIFVIAKQALCILPELSLLSSTEYGEVTTHGINSLAQYRMVFNLFAAIVMLAFGIYWFIRIRSYLKGIQNDRVYIDGLTERYRYTVGENASALLHHALRFSLLVLSVAAILSIELPFDGFNYLPHSLFALLIVIATRHLAPYFKPVAAKTARWALIYTLVSAVVWVYNLVYTRIIFGSTFDAEEEGLTLSYAAVLENAIQKDFFAMDGFIVLCVLSIVEAIIFAILVVQLTKLLQEILVKYTPKKEELSKKDSNYEEWEALLPSSTKKTKQLTNLRLLFMKLSGWICAACGPVQVALSFLYPTFWLIAFIFRVLWIILFYLTVSKAKELEQTDYDMIEDPQPPHEMVK